MNLFLESKTLMKSSFCMLFLRFHMLLATSLSARTVPTLSIPSPATGMPSKSVCASFWNISDSVRRSHRSDFDIAAILSPSAIIEPVGVVDLILRLASSAEAAVAAAKKGSGRFVDVGAAVVVAPGTSAPADSAADEAAADFSSRAFCFLLASSRRRRARRIWSVTSGSCLGLPSSSSSSHSSRSKSSPAASPFERSTVAWRRDTGGGDDADDDADPPSFSALAANTVFWYRGAERLLRRELASIMSRATPDGRLDPSSLGPESLELLRVYMDHQNAWQEVCLVIDRDERTGRSVTVTINRPMAFKLSRSLGRLVLLGPGEGSVGVRDTQNLVKFLSAFEGSCGVYLGGPDDMDKPAVMIHGVRELEGAEEISPGTGIFRGGVEAAMDGVLSGRYKPLDFRFFIGHANYAGGRLDEAVRSGKYQPVACSRPLVLKQCIQLPKPLWHEGAKLPCIPCIFCVSRGNPANNVCDAIAL